MSQQSDRPWEIREMVRKRMELVMFLTFLLMRI